MYILYVCICKESQKFEYCDLGKWTFHIFKYIFKPAHYYHIAWKWKCFIAFYILVLINMAYSSLLDIGILKIILELLDY